MLWRAAGPAVSNEAIMKELYLSALALSVAAALAGATPVQVEAPAGSWPTWRGFEQAGHSPETGLPDAALLEGEGANLLWTHGLRGRGAPVVFGGRLFGMGYEGSGQDLQEVLFCLDAATGEPHWELRFNDYLSDAVYDRYAISSPVVDVTSGNVIFMTTPGIFGCVTADGEWVWKHELMTEFGRLTFPNSRVGAPIIDGELVIIHMINSHWGPNGPARDRVYAFEKDTGRHVWTSLPGETPVDNSMANPVFDWVNGRRVLYFGTGCGNLVAIDARTGEPLWRYKMSIGGLNSGALLFGDTVIAIHGRENLDSSSLGRMVAIKRGAEPAAGEPGPVVLDSEWEVWRNELGAFSSSPVLVGDRIYQTVQTGELCAVDAATGEVLWEHKLGTDQLHASPLAADGKLYVPVNSGAFYVVRPADEGPEILSEVRLEGACLGAPAIADGRIYVHTTERLYCFGDGDRSAVATAAVEWDAERPELELGAPARLQLVPGDVLLRPGESVALDVRLLDARGNLLGEHASGVELSASPGLGVEFASTQPELFGLVVPEEASPSVGVVKAVAGSGEQALVGSARVRIVPNLPYLEDFEGFELTLEEKGVPMAHPPGFWLGGRPKWDVREVDGTQALAKTLHTPLFQRAITFFGHPDASDYSCQVDIRTDGNRRLMSNAGLIHQGYLFTLKNNHRELEISSNVERLKEVVEFRSKPEVWYTMKTEVRAVDGGPGGFARAKVWPRDEPEPDEWTLTAQLNNVHPSGAPGLFGFAFQSRFRVYLDNLRVTPND